MKKYRPGYHWSVNAKVKIKTLTLIPFLLYVSKATFFDQQAAGSSRKSDKIGYLFSVGTAFFSFSIHWGGHQKENISF